MLLRALGKSCGPPPGKVARGPSAVFCFSAFCFSPKYGFVMNVVSVCINGRIKTPGPFGGRGERRMRLLLCSPLFLLSSAWLAHGGPNTSTTPDWYIAEREGLEELYDSTGGPGWLRQRGWKQPWSCHCTDWQGITCGKCRNQWGGGCDHSNSTIDPVTGCRIERVSNIQMGSNNLTGTTLPTFKPSNKVGSSKF